MGDHPASELGATLVWRPDAAGTARAFTPVEWCDPGAGDVLAAESFRVVDGHARGLSHHRERFLAGIATMGGALPAGAPAAPPADALAAFWSDAVTVVARLARSGPLFPRVEVRTRGELRLLARPSPVISSTAVLATASHDPRRVPRVKGPDLERLAALRAAAQPQGADEAIIVDARGRVIEGAYSSVIWARDDRLFVIAEPAPRIPSVTERLVVDAAAAAGRPVTPGSPFVDELAGASVWVLSALHGARAVTGWVDGPRLARAPHGDAWLDEVLRSAVRPLTDGAAGAAAPDDPRN